MIEKKEEVVKKPEEVKDEFEDWVMNEEPKLPPKEEPKKSPKVEEP